MYLMMYAVYDSCAGVYDRPFCAPNDAVAVRSFTDIANDKNHPIGQHPEHYSLHKVGIFDDANAEIEPDQFRACLTTALTCVTQQLPPEPAHADKLDMDGYPVNGGDARA